MNATFSRQDRLPFLLICLYASTELIPGANTADVMGTQWFYLTIINLLGIFYISYAKDQIIKEAAHRMPRTLLYIIYLFLFVIVCSSAGWAINRTEALVGLARWVNMFIMFFCIAVLFYRRLHLLKWLAGLLTALLLVQCLMILSQFFKGVEGEAEIDKLIYSIKLNTGNKNILAAGLLMKIPFVLYFIYRSISWKRILFAAILLPAALSVFILNARAAYIGLLLELLCFVILLLIIHFRKTKIQELLLSIFVTVLPVVIAFFLSAQLIKSSADENETSPYGTVAERLSSISLTAEGSNSRLQQWASAIDFIKKNPLKGCGVSNWKLASIPYEKTFVNDLMVVYHVHNDYLEVTTETGWIGGLLYLSLFAIVFFYLLRAVNRSPGGFQPILFISLPILFAYACDAFFNFPLERPVMQFYFALLLGSALNIYLLTRNNKATAEKKKNTKQYFVLTTLLLLLPAAYINYQTYRSLIAQAMVNKDIMQPVPEAKTEDVLRSFPTMPDMNSYTFPIGNIKAIYLLRDKKYDEAIQWLDRSKNVNPYLSLDEFLRAKIYYETNKIDSADKYIRLAFAAKPRSRSSYEMLNSISVAKKDTSLLQPAFYEYIHYRPEEPSAWNMFLVNGYNLQMNRINLAHIADSALNKFPGNEDLTKTRDVIIASLDTISKTASATKTTIIVNKNDDPEFRKEFDMAMTLFTNKDYKNAIQHFSKASALNPEQYLCIENMGICYYSLADYEKAMGYFDRVIRSKRSSDGKSEFFKAACLISLNKKDEACPLLRISEKKLYSQAAQLIATYCQ